MVGHRCATVPFKIHRFAHKGHHTHTHTFLLSEKMYDAVVRQMARRVFASRKNCASAALGRMLSIWLPCQNSTLYRLPIERGLLQTRTQQQRSASESERPKVAAPHEINATSDSASTTAVRTMDSATDKCIDDAARFVAVTHTRPVPFGVVIDS